MEEKEKATQLEELQMEFLKIKREKKELQQELQQLKVRKKRQVNLKPPPPAESC